MAWFDNLDDEARASAVAKGWDRLDGEVAAQRIFASYRNLERTRPEAPPATPDGYQFNDIKASDGSAPDGELLNFVRDLAFDLKLPQSAVAPLTNKLLAFGDAAEQSTMEAARAAIENGTTALKTAWGADYEKRTDIAGRAFEALGLPKETVDSLISSLGVQQTMEMGHTLGTKMGEAPLLRGDHMGNAPQPLTREQALIERNNWMTDTEFYKKLEAGDAATKQRFEEVTRAIIGTPENWQTHPENFGRTKENPNGDPNWRPV